MTRSRLCLTAVLAGAFTCGCGGGSGDPVGDDRGAVSYYSGFGFREAPLLAIMRFDGGLTYGFYQGNFYATPAPVYAYEGFFVARPKPDGDRTRLEGAEFRFDDRTERPVSLSVLHADEERFRGVLTDDGRGASDDIFGIGAPVSEERTRQNTLAGTYAVQARSTIDSARGRAMIDAAGQLEMSLSPACQATATLAPRALGNLYDVSARLGDACALGGGTYTGHGIQSFGTANVYLMLTKPSGGGVLLLLVPH